MRRQKNQKRRGPSDGSSAPRRGRGFWLAGAILAVLLALGTAWIFRQSPRRPPQTGPSPSASILAALIPDEKQVFAGYAGSASCQQCHAEAYELWKASHHGMAERAPAAGLDARAFQPARTFPHGTQHTDVGATNGEYHVVALGAAKSYESFPVERVIGHEPLRQFLVKFSGGRYQTLEASYDPRRHDWFNVYGNEDRQPGEWGHWTGRGMNWNHMCAGCHNTRLRKNYDERTDSYRTTMAEMSVGCEACHGPLKAHNDWQKQSGKSGRNDPTVPQLSPAQVAENCGFCHARRDDLTGDFKPGDDFFDHMRLTIVDHTDVFYPDGQVREEDYEYAAFLGSRMHQQGVRCTDCHQPHTAQVRLAENMMCLSCHDGSRTNAPAIDPVQHSFHKVDPLYLEAGGVDLIAVANRNPDSVAKSGGECVNCHMPQTTYMQRHRRHDHGFTIPDPLLTKQHGIPNACNRCHQDKNVDWSVEWVEKWYGAKMDRPSRRRAQVIAAARTGNAAAREGLLKLLATEENPYWRAVAAGLSEPWSREPAVSAALVRGLADSNALVRAECIRALEPLVDGDVPGVVELVRARLEDPIRSVRLAAAWAVRSSVDPASRAGRELIHSLDLHADQPAGQMQKGAWHLARNDTPRALTHYERAVKWDANSAPLRHELAVVLSQLNRSPEAVAQLEAACKLEPRNAEYPYKLALAWNEVGDTTKTIAALELAVKLDPGHARAWYNLGLALNSAGRTEEALTALLRAESAAPVDPRSPYARATILARMGRINEARQAARRAVEIQPGFTPAQELLRTFRQR